MSANQTTNQPTNIDSTTTSVPQTPARILVGFVNVAGIPGYDPIRVPVFEEETSITRYNNQNYSTSNIDLSELFDETSETETLGSSDTNDTETTEVFPPISSIPAGPRDRRVGETAYEYLLSDDENEDNDGTGTEIADEEAQDSDNFVYETASEETDTDTEGRRTPINVDDLPVRRFSNDFMSYSIPIPPPPRGWHLTDAETPPGIYCRLCAEIDEYDREVSRAVSFICCNCPQGYCHECSGKMRLTNICPFCRGNMFMPRNHPDYHDNDDDDDDEPPRRRRRY